MEAAALEAGLFVPSTAAALAGHAPGLESPALLQGATLPISTGAGLSLQTPALVPGESDAAPLPQHMVPVAVLGKPAPAASIRNQPEPSDDFYTAKEQQTLASKTVVACTPQSTAASRPKQLVTAVIAPAAPVAVAVSATHATQAPEVRASTVACICSSHCTLLLSVSRHSVLLCL